MINCKSSFAKILTDYNCLLIKFYLRAYMYDEKFNHKENLKPNRAKDLFE